VQGWGSRVWGLGLGVWGLGLGIGAWGFRVQGLGSTVWGLGIGVWGLGLGIGDWGLGFIICYLLHRGVHTPIPQVVEQRVVEQHGILRYRV
jgi:uncharacterized membrane protein YbhN (UPF0104 family)